MQPFNQFRVQMVMEMNNATKPTDNKSC